METVVAFILGAIVSQGANEPFDIHEGCELVDVGGYFNYADPTCRPFEDDEDDDDDPVIKEGV